MFKRFIAVAFISIFSSFFTPVAFADNKMQVVVSGPDSDGITNVGICFTNPSELSGSVTYNIEGSSSGGFLKHEGTPACPSYASGSTGNRLIPGQTYNYSATATNNGKSFSASASYTAPAVDPAIENARLARVAAEADFRQRQDIARNEAEAKSLAWNKENPGKQKCFQWGPIVHANGVSTASGGACANVVGSARSPFGPNSETSTGTSAGSGLSETETTKGTSDTSTLVIPPSSGLAEVVEVPGQGDCPGGNEGWRRNLEVNATTGVTVTHCVRIETIIITTDLNTRVSVTRVVGADPYPNLAIGAEIPGTRTLSTTEVSWAQFATNSMRGGWACPKIYGPNGDPYAGESNGFDTSVGKWFRVCVKNPWREANAIVISSSPVAETGTVTSQIETGTVTSQADMRIVEISTIAAIQDLDSRTATAAILFKAYSVTDKENLLKVLIKSSKLAVIKVSTDVPSVNIVVTLSKKGEKTMIYKVKTDSEGKFQMTSSKKLIGFTVSLLMDKVRLDSDLVRK